MSDTPFVIVGAGGWGLDVFDLVTELAASGRRFACTGFLDDGTPDATALARRGVPHLGPLDRLAELGGHTAVLLGIGTGQARQAVEARLPAHEALAAVVHPRAYVGPVGNEFGEGTVVAALAHVSTNVRAGRHVAIHPHATVGHDCVLDDHATVFPGATVSGNVHLGRGVTVGAGATVIQGVHVGAGAFVGAGACVVRDVAPGSVVGGVPARPLVQS